MAQEASADSLQVTALAIELQFRQMALAHMDVHRERMLRADDRGEPRRIPLEVEVGIARERIGHGSGLEHGARAIGMCAAEGVAQVLRDLLDLDVRARGAAQRPRSAPEIGRLDEYALCRSVHADERAQLTQCVHSSDELAKPQHVSTEAVPSR